MNSDELSNGNELANKRGIVLKIVESSFQNWSYLSEKTPDDAEKFEKLIDDVKLWRALMSSPAVLSGVDSPVAWLSQGLVLSGTVAGRW